MAGADQRVDARVFPEGWQSRHPLADLAMSGFKRSHSNRERSAAETHPRQVCPDRSTCTKPRIGVWSRPAGTLVEVSKLARFCWSRSRKWPDSRRADRILRGDATRPPPG